MHRNLLVIVPRFRRSSNFLRPVQRIKHVIDSQGADALGVAADTTLIKASDAPVLANTNEVQTGSKVHGIYLRVEGVNTGVTGVLANWYLIIVKNPGGNITVPVANAVGVSDNKRFVIHQEMLMFQMQDNSNPRTLFNGVIKIPRGYSRFGPNDTLILRTFSPGVETNWCVQCHYKEFR